MPQFHPLSLTSLPPVLDVLANIILVLGSWLCSSARMDRVMWSFLLNSPQTTVPYPWERCYDMMTEILFYKNGLNGTMVIDLRSRVDLGDGLYHVNTMWRDLRGCTCNHHCPTFQRHRQELPHIVHATCCGPLVYLLVPEILSRCPICHGQLTYINHIMT